jgi:hypothetical protein
MPIIFKLQDDNFNDMCPNLSLEFKLPSMTFGF